MLQAFPEYYYALARKADYYQHFASRLCDCFTNVTIFYMAHDWHMMRGWRVASSEMLFRVVMRAATFARGEGLG